MVNVLCAVLLGPGYGLAAAFVASLLRNLLGLGSLLAWPIAIAFMGKSAGDVAFYAYVVPFLVSTVGGSILAGILVLALQRSGALKALKKA